MKNDVLGIRKHRSHTWGMYPANTSRVQGTSFPPRFPERELPGVRYIPVPDVDVFEIQESVNSYQQLMFFPVRNRQYPITPVGTHLTGSNQKNVSVVLTLFSGPHFMHWDGEKYTHIRESEVLDIPIGYLDQLYAKMEGKIDQIENYCPLPVQEIADCSYGQIANMPIAHKEGDSFRDNLR